MTSTKCGRYAADFVLLVGMQNKQLKISDRADAAVLDRITVRLIVPGEQERRDQPRK